MVEEREIGTESSKDFRVSDEYRWYVLWMLFVVYVVNFVDRQIMTILVEPIKEEFDFSDSQMGILSGLAFALLYATLGIPIAGLADRKSRRNIIALSLLVWSFFTALCGFAQNFWHLLAARIGVGIGEAGCSPPAYSLISDYFPPAKRTSAISIYSMGIFGGVFVGFLLGGWIENALGWRFAFFAVGIPGIFLSAFVRLTLREPPRGYSEPAKVVSDAPGIAVTTRNLCNNPAFLHMAFAAALHAFVAYGVGGFTPSFLQRSHGMPLAVVGTWMAIITAAGGIVGTFLGGYLSERNMKTTGDQRYLLWIPAISTLLNVPLQILTLVLWTRLELPLLGATPVVVFLLIPTWLVGTMYLGPTFALTQNLVSIRERAVAGAILLFIINLVGLGAGPWLTGVLSDVFRNGLIDSGTTETLASAEGLRYSLLVMTCVNVWSAIHYFLAARCLEAPSNEKPA